MYICGDGVVISDSSTMATFLCDDPDATFNCKLNGKKYVHVHINIIVVYIPVCSYNKHELCHFLMSTLIFNFKSLLISCSR